MAHTSGCGEVVRKLPPKRLPNRFVRSREYLTPAEVETYVARTAAQVPLPPESKDEVLKRLRDFGLARAHSVLAHCDHMGDADLDLTASIGAGVAHCPLSNAYFAGAVFPARRAIARISSLLKPRSGRSTGISGETCEITPRFCNVCDDTCPTASPVTIPSRRRRRARRAAARTICRLRRICQFCCRVFSLISAVSLVAACSAKGAEPEGKVLVASNDVIHSWAMPQSTGANRRQSRPRNQAKAGSENRFGARCGEAAGGGEVILEGAPIGFHILL